MKKEEAALYRFAERRKVVVVGGGFAGRKVAKSLQSAFHVTLVDPKDYFLSLISLPGCVCDIDHLNKVVAPHTTVRCRSISSFHISLSAFPFISPLPCPYIHQYLDQCEVVVDEVVGVNTERNALQLKSRGSLSYDYLVLCTGSRYVMPLEGNDKLLVIDPLHPDTLKEYSTNTSVLCLGRTESFELIPRPYSPNRHYESLRKAKHVAIIGAGPVGIEIAGEIVHYFPGTRRPSARRAKRVCGFVFLLFFWYLSTEKQLNIVYAGKRMLERCCKGAHGNVKKFLTEGTNVRIYKDQKVTGTEDDQLLTNKVMP
jgi:hypothetical protein